MDALPLGTLFILIYPWTVSKNNVTYIIQEIVRNYFIACARRTIFLPCTRKINLILFDWKIIVCKILILKLFAKFAAANASNIIIFLQICSSENFYSFKSCANISKAYIFYCLLKYLRKFTKLFLWINVLETFPTKHLATVYSICIGLLFLRKQKHF